MFYLLNTKFAWVKFLVRAHFEMPDVLMKTKSEGNLCNISGDQRSVKSSFLILTKKSHNSTSKEKNSVSDVRDPASVCKPPQPIVHIIYIV